MVVGRNTAAAAPAAPISRTSSSQPIPRKQKQHQLPEQELSPLKKTPSDAPTSSSSPGGGSSNKLRKPKPKTFKVKEKVTTASSTFLDKLFFFSLFAFALYAAVVCPQHAHDMDASQTPLTCKALSSYRSNILEPYLLPPLKFAYNSPLVEPYRHQLEEVAHKVEGAVNPWYHRAFLPRWRQHVVPRYHQAVAFAEPRYHQALARAKVPLQPYLSQFDAHYSQLEQQFHLYWKKAEVFSAPYVVQARHVWSEVEPLLERAAEATRQVLHDAWTIAKPHLITGANYAQTYAKVGLKHAADARRNYVDPHIKTMLEQVNGNGKHTPESVAPSTPATEPAHVEPTPVKVEATEVIPTTVVDVPEVVDTAPSATPPEGANEVLDEVIPEATASEPAVASSTPSPISVQAVPAHNTVEDDIRAVSVAVESVHADPSNIEEALAEPTGPAKDLEQDVKAHLSGLGANAQKTPEVAEDLELDDFLSELGLEPEAPKAVSVAAPAPEPTSEEEQPVPVEEDTRTEAEKKKAAVAAKRKEIVDRHIEWQRQIDELFDVQEKRVWVDIEGVRNWAVSELGDEFAPKGTEQLTKAPGLPESRYKRANPGKGEGLGAQALEGLNKQGARFIRGLETYLGSLETRKSGWTDKAPEQLSQVLDKEREKWDGVLDKVEERFGKLINDVQGDIHKWYTNMKMRENEVINEAAESLRKLAEQAQADIAMDYAWLDDVSTRDWANYHELMTTYEDFQKTCLAIQNGSYVPEGIFVLDPNAPEQVLTPPPDPLIEALNNLQAEWNDLVLGFQLSVQNVKKRALELLSVSGPEDSETPEGTFRIKNEKGKRVDDMRDYLAQAKERLESGMKEEGVDEAGRIVVGKDPVVVAENLKGKPVEHVEL